MIAASAILHLNLLLLLFISTYANTTFRRRLATPILGWNNCQIDCAPILPNDSMVRGTASYLISTGLASAGYNHLNLDDAWMSSKRDSNNRLQPNTTRFPNFTDTIAFVRSLNLTIGLYTAAGDQTCSGKAGSCYHENIDADQFIQWGVTHVKDDACSTCRNPLKKGAPSDYFEMSKQLQVASNNYHVNKPILMVEGQPPFPAAASGQYGDVRRVGHDINPNWLSILSLIDLGSGLHSYSKPGLFFNDLEMMEIGNYPDFVPDMNEESYERSKAHMIMWSIMKSPLVLSTDLSKISKETLSIVTNKICLQVNQDVLGIQARRIKSSPPTLHVKDNINTIRRNERDVVAVAAKCNTTRHTQKWRWSPLNSEEKVKIKNHMNGTLWTIDKDGFGWCMGMPYSGIWSIIPYTIGNHTNPTFCTNEKGEISSWRAVEDISSSSPSSLKKYSFIWRTGNRPYGFAWGQDFGSSGPVPHTRWLQSNKGGNWTVDMTKLITESGTSLSPVTNEMIDDDGVGNVVMKNGQDFCLDIVSGGNVETWIGPLHSKNSKKRAVAILNRSPFVQNVNILFTEVGIVQNVSNSNTKITVTSAFKKGYHLYDGSGYSIQVHGHSAELLVMEVHNNIARQ
jgi:alpha-galactosidase